MKRIKKLVLIILTVLMALPVSAEVAESEGASNKEFDWDPVINALIQVESGGNANAKGGNSVGVLQITPICVAECNQILRSRKSKKRYKLSDRFSIQKSKEMFLLFQSKYNPMNNIEKAIRSWNGGIHYSVKRTQRYYEKVMKAMQNAF
jgi:hypothetical protein